MKRSIWLLCWLMLLPSLALAATDKPVCIYPSGTTDCNGTASQIGGNYEASYTTMALMEAGEDGDLTAGGGTRLVVEITASDGTWEGSPDTDNTNFDGWVCDYSAGEYIWIYTIGDAKPSSPAFFDETAYTILHEGAATGITIDNDFDVPDIAIVFEDIQIHGTESSSLRNITFSIGGYVDTVKFNRCWFQHDAADEGGIYLGNPAAAGAEVYITNSVFFGGDDAVGSWGANLTTYIINCTFAGQADDSIRLDAGVVYPINNALFYNTDDFQGVFPAGYPLNCATDEGAGEGTGGIDLTPGVQATDLAVTFVQPVESTNLVSNGGFETCAGCTKNDNTTDDFANWTETAPANNYADWTDDIALEPEGSYVLGFYRDASATTIDQTVTLAASTEYVISYLGYSDATATGAVSLQDDTDSSYLQDNGTWGVGANDVNSLAISTSDTAWVYKSFMFTSNSAGGYSLILESEVNTGLLYIDDVKIYATPRVDYRLTGVTTTADIVRQGVPQSTESRVPSDDIVGMSRPTGATAPSIGAFETLLGLGGVSGSGMGSFFFYEEVLEW